LFTEANSKVKFLVNEQVNASIRDRKKLLSTMGILDRVKQAQRISVKEKYGTFYQDLKLCMVYKLYVTEELGFWSRTGQGIRISQQGSSRLWSTPSL
jgi:hypothetical protein